MATLRRRWTTLLWGLPALLALGYLIGVLIDFRQIITWINMNGDVVVAPILAKLVGQAPSGSHVLLGNHSYYEEFLFLRATAGLSLYRQLWDVMPFLWTMLGFGILGWTVYRALGSFAALLAVSAVLCVGPLGRLSFFSFDWHGLSVFHTILIGAVLVWLTPKAAQIRWRTLIAISVLLGLATAFPLASDPVFPFWAVVPLLLTSAVIGWRGAGRLRATLPAFAVITTVVALLGAVLIAQIMRSQGIAASPFLVTFVSPANIINNVELLFEGLMSLGGGYFFTMQPSLYGYAVLVSGALLIAALVLGLVEVRRLAGSAGVRPQRGEPASATLAYVCFWTSSLLVQSAMFVFTSAPVDTLSSRYVLAGYVAVAALVPLLALRGIGWRLAVTAGVSVFAASAIYQLVRQPIVPSTAPAAAESNQVLRFAEAHHVRYGYAGYSDAEDLTWLTLLKLKLYPVASGCGPAGLCPLASVQIDTWYRPRPGTHSILIADPSQPGVASIDPRLGRPLATTQIGNLTVAVYPFDLAREL